MKIDGFGKEEMHNEEMYDTRDHLEEVRHMQAEMIELLEFMVENDGVWFSHFIPAEKIGTEDHDVSTLIDMAEEDGYIKRGTTGKLSYIILTYDGWKEADECGLLED